VILFAVAASYVLLIVGWALAAGYVYGLGGELYRDPYLYLFRSDHRGTLPTN
jgi:hypothetical protein